MALLAQWYYKLSAGLCSSAALAFACYQIYRHLQNYTSPVYQRYIIRIIFMVPLYAVMSLLSLLMPNNSIYFDSVRDCYEAFVIYNFLSLCLAYVGGPGSVEVKMNGYQLEPSWLYWTCCLPPIPVNGKFVRLCKQGALQFVLIKPPLAILQIVLYTQGKFHDGRWKPNDGYLWIAIIYNFTYSAALYALLLFYLGTHELLAPFNPLLKFAMVKMVVFLTFWQSLLVSILAGSGVLASNRDQKNLSNFLICLEMLPAAVGMLFAFPYQEYKEENAAGGGLGNVRHVISIRDVMSDTMHQFAPTYHDYVLYSNGGSKEAPKKVRAKTFIPVGIESSGKNAVAKDHMQANLLANMDLGGNQRSNTPRGTADSAIQMQPLGKSDDPVYQMRGTDESDDMYYSRGPLRESDEGEAAFSAAVDGFGTMDVTTSNHSHLLRKVNDEESPMETNAIDEISAQPGTSHSPAPGHKPPARKGNSRQHSPQRHRLNLHPSAEEKGRKTAPHAAMKKDWEELDLNSGTPQDTKL